MSRGGHQTDLWYKRAARQKRLHPVCLGCAAIGRTSAAEVADHIIPIVQGGSLLTGELQSCCRRCHSTTKRELERRFALGQCKPLDLRLDSEMAKQLRRRQRGGMRYGVDGRPLDDPDDGRESPPALTEWVSIAGEEEPATPEPTHSLPQHLRAMLERQRARKVP